MSMTGGGNGSPLTPRAILRVGLDVAGLLSLVIAVGIWVGVVRVQIEDLRVRNEELRVEMVALRSDVRQLELHGSAVINSRLVAIQDDIAEIKLFLRRTPASDGPPF